MNSKKAKLMRRMAKQLSIVKPTSTSKEIYKQLKSVYKPNKV